MIFSPWGHEITYYLEPISVRDNMSLNASIGYFSSNYNWANIKNDYDFDYHTLLYKPYNLSNYEMLNWPTVIDEIKFTKWVGPIIDQVLDEPPELEEFIQLDHNEQHAAAMFTSECDILKKLTNVKFKRPFYYIDAHDANQIKIPDFYKVTMNNLMSSLLSNKDLIQSSLFGDPLDTNSGMPFSESSFEAKIRSAMLYSGMDHDDAKTANLDNYYRTRLPASMVNRLNDLGHRFALPAACMIGVIAGRRSGPSRKPGPIFNNDDNLSIIGEQSNIPRSRQIFMSSYVYNLLVTHTYRRLKSARLKIQPANHPSSMEWFQNRIKDLAKLSKVLIIEIDSSSFDKTVPLDLRNVMLTHPALLKSVPRYESFYTLMHSQLPYLSADPFDRGAGGVMFREFKNSAGLYSGIKLTSEIGSYCGLTILAAIAVKTGLCTQEDVVNNTWYQKMPVLNLGDDMLIAYPYETIDDVNLLTSVLDLIQKEIGMIFKVAIGYRFLMKHIVNDDAYPVYARILQQSIWNEHQRSGVIYGLGCLGRYDGLNECRQFISTLGTGKWSLKLKSLYSAIDAIFDSVGTASLHKSLRSFNRSQLRAKIISMSADLDDNATEFMDLYTTLQYSASGREILSLIDASPYLKKLLLSQSMKEHNLLVTAMKIMNLPPLL